PTPWQTGRSRPPRCGRTRRAPCGRGRSDWPARGRTDGRLTVARPPAPRHRRADRPTWPVRPGRYDLARGPTRRVPALGPEARAAPIARAALGMRPPADV